MEDFVPYELAVKLNEKGFNYETRDVYERNTLACRYEDIPKPTISQVLNWLREKKKIHLAVDIEPNGYFFIINYNITTNFDDKYEFNIYDSLSCYYDDKQAALAGIKYVIDNLI